jgi:hypothetical protein
VRQVGQEIVSNEECHEDEIIDDALHIEWHSLVEVWVFQFLEFQLQVFAHDAKVHQIEVLVFELLALTL